MRPRTADPEPRQKSTVWFALCARRSFSGPKAAKPGDAGDEQPATGAKTARAARRRVGAAPDRQHCHPLPRCALRGASGSSPDPRVGRMWSKNDAASSHHPVLRAGLGSILSPKTNGIARKPWDPNLRSIEKLNLGCLVAHSADRWSDSVIKLRPLAIASLANHKGPISHRSSDLKTSKLAFRGFAPMSHQRRGTLAVHTKRSGIQFPAVPFQWRPLFGHYRDYMDASRMLLFHTMAFRAPWPV